jgi:hypothetical protein
VGHVQNLPYSLFVGVIDVQSEEIFSNLSSRRVCSNRRRIDAICIADGHDVRWLPSTVNAPRGDRRQRLDSDGYMADTAGSRSTTVLVRGTHAMSSSREDDED